MVPVTELQHYLQLYAVTVSEHVWIKNERYFLMYIDDISQGYCASSPGDLVTKVKQIDGQSDLIWMTSFAGPSYLTIRSSVYSILI